MRKRRHAKKEIKPQLNLKMNEQITAQEVRVLDETGQYMGVMPVAQAVTLAAEKGFDLIEVSPNAVPPVTKFGNLGKLLYEEEKKMKKNKANTKKIDTKSIRISYKMGDHDRQIRMEQAVTFLEEGHKLKIESILRGREKQHGQLALEKVQQFVTDLQSKEDLPILVEQQPKLMGGQILAIVTKKK